MSNTIEIKEPQIMKEFKVWYGGLNYKASPNEVANWWLDKIEEVIKSVPDECSWCKCRGNLKVKQQLRQKYLGKEKV